MGVNGIVKNLGIEGGSLIGTNYAGSIAATNLGTIENCYNKADIACTGYYVGGIAGHNMPGAVIKNCNNSGTVSGSYGIGGIAGRNNGSTIQSCYNTGIVSGTGYSVGGVAGRNEGTVEVSYNTGSVNCTGDNVGGVSGYNVSGDSIVRNCYNTASISGGGSVGGVTGRSIGTIENCYNTGAVIGTGISVGGIAGWFESGTVTNCAALCPSVDGLSNVRRVIGKRDASINPGLTAWSGMTIKEGGVPVFSSSKEDGSDISTNTINTDGTIGGFFTSANGWITETGKLPGLITGPVDMLSHLR